MALDGEMEMQMTDEISSDIEQYYDAMAEQELDRLDVQRTEHAVTWRFLRTHLPTPPARIADIGGGPGRYALVLAADGYAVTLVDLSARVLELAKERALTTGVSIMQYTHANALDLSMLKSDAFDAVLLLGPLYHLLSEDDRKRALIEARRLLRPGGLIFAAFITRYAPLRDAARHRPLALVEEREWVQTILDTGQHHSPGTGRFTDAYFAHPSEIAPLMKSSGFTTLDLIACEGIVSGIDEQVNVLEGDGWEAWVELNYQLGRDPSIHGAAEHLLCVGRKDM